MVASRFHGMRYLTTVGLINMAWVQLQSGRIIWVAGLLPAYVLYQSLFALKKAACSAVEQI